MVTWRHELYLECDGKGKYGTGCNENVMYDDADTKVKHPTAKTFLRIAKKDGWEIGKDQLCYCPYCKADKAVENLIGGK